MHEHPSQPTNETVVAALLAGGGSRRMGRDKASLLLGGMTLGARAAASLAPLAAVRVQVGGAPLHPPGWPVLRDLQPGAGPAGGIATALEYFPGADVVVCAVDLPFVTAALLLEALRRLPGHDAAVPFHGGRYHPLAGAYSPRLLPLLQARLQRGEGSLQALLGEVAVAVIDPADLLCLGDPERLLFNVNTPEDLERARAWI